MQEKYFIASNSAVGFCSYYDEAFDINKFSRIYLIKGGPGTGKAQLMRSVARAAEDRGLGVRYIYCSSDHESLDAVIIKEAHVAVLDATAPHTREPKIVGAVETLVDLGAFLNEKVLSASRGVIEALTHEKQEGFARTYRYLHAYGELTENMQALTAATVRIDKLRAYASRLAERVDGTGGREGDIEHLLVRSIGMKGACAFDTYRERASVYYRISDAYESAHILLSELSASLRERGVDLEVSNDPIIPTRLNALRARKSGFTAEIGSGEPHDGDRNVNMRRFLDPDALSQIKNEYRTVSGARDEVLALALSELDKVRRTHFLLESIYGAAMDFEAKERFCTELCGRILAPARS